MFILNQVPDDTPDDCYIIYLTQTETMCVHDTVYPKQTPYTKPLQYPQESG